MSHSEKQAHKLWAQIEAFDNAICAAISNGTVVMLMRDRVQEMVSNIKDTQLLFC